MRFPRLERTIQAIVQPAASQERLLERQTHSIQIHLCWRVSYLFCGLARRPDRFEPPDTLSSLTVFATAGQANSVIGTNWDKGYARQRDWQSSLNPRALGI